MAEVGGKARRQPHGNDGADWLTLGQAAKYLESPEHDPKWSNQGRLPAFYTPGGHRRYRRRDLDAFVSGSANSAALVGAAHRSS